MCSPTRSVCIAALAAGVFVPVAGAAAGVDADGPVAIPRPKFKHRRAYRVVRVEDARTVVLRIAAKDATLRLAGLRQFKSIKPQESRSRMSKATAFLCNLLKGERVWVEFEGPGGLPRQRQPKAVNLYRVPDGLFVNLEMVRLGYAQTVVGQRTQHLKLLQHYERRARQIGKGLWGAAADTVKGPGDAAGDDEGPQSNQRGPIVYVSKKGGKYHRKGCRFVRRGAIPLSIGQAEARGLEPCESCKPER